MTYELSPKRIQEYKTMFKKEYGKDLTDEEAAEAARNMLGFFDILIGQAQIQARRHKRLETEPMGFPLEADKSYTCLICRDQFNGDAGWWDKWGQKCRLCQRAVEKHIIPGSLCRKDDGWHTRSELGWKFGIHAATAKKLVREGTLKPRVIKDDQGHVHCEIFIEKENPTLTTYERIDPKPAIIWKDHELKSNT